MRFFWTIFGIGAQGLLLLTVWYLFPFLEGTTPASAPGGEEGIAVTVGLDALLAAQFGLVHSLLLLPGIRDRLERWIPRPLYGSFFTAMTCSCLLALILAWRPSGVVLLRLEGTAGLPVRVAFWLTWVGVVYSMYLNGLGYQNGWTPFWAWRRRRRLPPRRFEPRGVYRLLRHPVYLGMLGLAWLTPVLTLDRAVLGVVWAFYIFLGSYLKDRRMEFYLGETYRQYAARVPGYPLVGIGPLGRARVSLFREEAASP